MTGRMAAALAAGVLGQGCALTAAAVVVWASSPPRITREAYATCLAEREWRRMDDPQYERDCKDPTSYPEPRASPKDYALIGLGFAIDVTVITVAMLSMPRFDLDLKPIKVGGP